MPAQDPMDNQLAGPVEYHYVPKADIFPGCPLYQEPGPLGDEGPHTMGDSPAPAGAPLLQPPGPQPGFA